MNEFFRKMTPTPTIHEPKQLAVCEPGEYYLFKKVLFFNNY